MTEAKPANPTDPVERVSLTARANRILSANDVGVLDEVGHVSVRTPATEHLFRGAEDADQ